VDARCFVCDSPALAQLAFTLLSPLAADLSICDAQALTDSPALPGGYETTVTSDDAEASESQSFQKRCESRLEYHHMELAAYLPAAAGLSQHFLRRDDPVTLTHDTSQQFSLQHDCDQTRDELQEENDKPPEGCQPTLDELQEENDHPASSSMSSSSMKDTSSLLDMSEEELAKEFNEWVLRKRVSGRAQFKWEGAEAVIITHRGHRLTKVFLQGVCATGVRMGAAAVQFQLAECTFRCYTRLLGMGKWLVKQAGGKGDIEEGNYKHSKQPAVQKNRTNTTRQDTQTQPLLLVTNFMPRDDTRPKSRYWMLTGFDDEPSFDQFTMNAMRVGREICPTTKKEHYDACIQFTKIIRVTAIKQIFPKQNLLVNQCNRAEFFAYSKKDGDFTDYGIADHGNQGERTDLGELIASVDEGDNFDTLARNR